MMVKPGITKLDKCVDSRYTLVAMAAKRARMIGKAVHDGLTDNDGNKPVTTAVNEIADGRVGYVRSEEIKRAREWEEEKFAAIQHMTEYESETEEVLEEAQEDAQEEYPEETVAEAE